MALEIKHATQIIGEGSGAGEVGKSAWNAPLDATMATDRMLGRASTGVGNVEELTGEQVRAIAQAVQGIEIAAIQALTQAEYDGLTPDASTLYVIVD